MEKLREEREAAAEARTTQGEAEVEWSTHLEGLRSSLGESQREVARLDSLVSTLREENRRLEEQRVAAEEGNLAQLEALKVSLISVQVMWRCLVLIGWVEDICCS